MKSLLLFLILSPFLLKAQDLTGFWKGKLTQDSGGYAPQYILEMSITQKKKNFYGESNAYLGNVVVAKLSFSGYFYKDSVYISESKLGVIKKVVPPDYLLCAKNFILKYNKSESGVETLNGRWDGIAYAENNLPYKEEFKDSFGDNIKKIDCVPGLIYLSKNDALQIQTIVPEENFVFPDSILNTKITIFEEIDVDNQIVEISISDYEKVDGDRVTIILNRDTIAENVSVRKSPQNFTLQLSSKNINNELLIYANNLGRIPPNTSLIVIKDGDKIHKVYISSDFKSTAAIHLNYKKK